MPHGGYRAFNNNKLKRLFPNFKYTNLIIIFKFKLKQKMKISFIGVTHLSIVYGYAAATGYKIMFMILKKVFLKIKKF